MSDKEILDPSAEADAAATDERAAARSAKEATSKRLTWGQLIVRRFLRNKPAVVGLAIVGFLILLSIFGGTAALAPRQTKTLAQVAIRSLVAATLACLMMAAVAGVFYGKGLLVLQMP